MSEADFEREAAQLFHDLGMQIGADSLNFFQSKQARRSDWKTSLSPPKTRRTISKSTHTSQRKEGEKRLNGSKSHSAPPRSPASSKSRTNGARRHHQAEESRREKSQPPVSPSERHPSVVFCATGAVASHEHNDHSHRFRRSSAHLKKSSGTNGAEHSLQTREAHAEPPHNRTTVTTSSAPRPSATNSGPQNTRENGHPPPAPMSSQQLKREAEIAPDPEKPKGEASHTQVIYSRKPSLTILSLTTTSSSIVHTVKDRDLKKTERWEQSPKELETNGRHQPHQVTEKTDPLAQERPKVLSAPRSSMRKISNSKQVVDTAQVSAGNQQEDRAEISAATVQNGDYDHLSSPEPRSSSKSPDDATTTPPDNSNWFNESDRSRKSSKSSKHSSMSRSDTGRKLSELYSRPTSASTSTSTPSPPPVSPTRLKEDERLVKPAKILSPDSSGHTASDTSTLSSGRSTSTEKSHTSTTDTASIRESITSPSSTEGYQSSLDFDSESDSKRKTALEVDFRRISLERPSGLETVSAVASSTVQALSSLMVALTPSLESLDRLPSLEDSGNLQLKFDVSNHGERTPISFSGLSSPEPADSVRSTSLSGFTSPTGLMSPVNPTSVTSPFDMTSLTSPMNSMYPTNTSLTSPMNSMYPTNTSLKSPLNSMYPTNTSLTSPMNINPEDDEEFFGYCVKCNMPVIGIDSGCLAMGNVYHFACFTCSKCSCLLSGRNFFMVRDGILCDADYLTTLETCRVCQQRIRDRVLKAFGHTYHPACFRCNICGMCLDGVPYTSDDSQKVFCIQDYHRTFAPRCAACNQPIVPQPGKVQSLRVIAMDRSFHVQCYRCEECGKQLASKSGGGEKCYPLEEHLLCRECHTMRLQLFTRTTAL